MAERVKFNRVHIGDYSYGMVAGEADGVRRIVVSGWVAKDTPALLHAYQAGLVASLGLAHVGISIQRVLRAGGAKLYPSERLKRLELVTGEVYNSVGMESIQWESDHTSSASFTMNFVQSE